MTNIPLYIYWSIWIDRFITSSLSICLLMEEFKYLSKKYFSCIPLDVRCNGFKKYFLISVWGFPGGTSGEEPTCPYRRHKRSEFDPWVRKISYRRKWQPTPVFLFGEPHRQRSLVGYTVHGVTKGQTWLKQLIHPQLVYTFSPAFPFSSLGPRVAEMLSVSQSDSERLAVAITTRAVSKVARSLLKIRTGWVKAWAIHTLFFWSLYICLFLKPHSMVSYFSIVHILHLNTFPFMEVCEQKKSSLKENANWRFKQKETQSLAFHPSSSASL